MSIFNLGNISLTNSNTPSSSPSMSRSAKSTNPEKIWDALKEGIDQIYLKQGMPRQRYMELHTHVYDYCTQQQNFNSRPQTKVMKKLAGAQKKPPRPGLELYQKIKEFLKKHLDTLRAKGAELLDESALSFYTEQWEEFKFSTKVLNGICAYLNRHWVKKEVDAGTKDVYEIYNLALLTWQDALFKILKDKVTHSILEMIKRERRGESINTILISRVLDNYVQLGIVGEGATLHGPNLSVYQKHFEIRFIQDTEDFYNTGSAAFLENNPVTEYLKYVESRLKEEERRVQVYLHESTKTALTKKCEDVLIKKHLDTLHAEFKNLLTDEKDEDLARMYNLTSRVPEDLSKLYDLLEENIHSKAMDTIDKCCESALGDPRLYVTTLLDIHRKFNELVVASFKNDTGFIAAMDKAFCRFVNNNAVTKQAGSASKSPELLARYCDSLLKKSAKNPEESEMEDSLNSVMIIFKYVEDKDVFEKFYSRMLARRLVAQNSASDDAEASVISKLRAICGYEYTNKLQRMFTDMNIGKDLNDKFKKHLSATETLDVDFSVQVLSSGSWPFQQSATFTLPFELEKSLQRFSTFYKAQHNGRKLQWLYQLSKAELVTNCFKNKYSLQSSTFQVAVLLMYNDSDNYTVEQIHAQTQIKMDILQQVLGILLKVRLLVSDSKDSENLAMEDVVRLYKNYKNKKLRVNINVPMKSEQKHEQEQTHKCIEEDRKLLIEAGIVRIMKMRKVLKHQSLITEVVTQLSTRFNPGIPVIKKCIGSLIEREYMERVSGEKATYSYIA